MAEEERETDEAPEIIQREKAFRPTPKKCACFFQGADFT